MSKSVLVLLALLGGCAIDDGRGFAQLRAALHSSFRALEPARGRLGADGWIRTDNSFELRPSRLELRLRGLELLTAAAAEASTSTPVVRVPATVAPHDLLGAGTREEPRGCVPSCELAAGEIGAVRVLVDQLRLAATLRDASGDARLGGKQPALLVDWALGGATLALKLEPAERVDRASPYYLAMVVELPVTETLLDAIEWQALERAPDGSLLVDAAHNSQAGAKLAQNLARTTIRVSVTRSEL
jgi:hypothetical protein